MSDSGVETLFKGTITNTELARWLEKATEDDGRPGFRLAVERLEGTDERETSDDEVKDRTPGLTVGSPVDRGARLHDRIAELEAALQAVADECKHTGGEYWMGTAEVPAILQKMYDESEGHDE